jgi:hypothetical protein
MLTAAQQVVQALAARLVPMPATGGRVITSRTVTIEEADLPCWRVVYVNEDSVERYLSGVDRLQLEVQASVYARDVLDLDNELATLMAAGQALLFADPAPYGLQRDAVVPDVVAVGEAAAGRLSLNLRATYVVRPAQPGTLLSS